MTLPRRLGHGRLGHFGLSLQRTWGLLVTLVVFLLLMQLRYMLDQPGSSAVDDDGLSFKRLLREGYSNSGDNRFRTESYQDAHDSNRHAGETVHSKQGSERFEKKNGDKASNGRHGLKTSSQQAGQNDGRRQVHPPDRKDQKDVASSQKGGEKKTLNREEKNHTGSKEMFGIAGTDEQLLSYVQKLDTKPHEKWIVLDVTSGKCRGKLSVPSGWKVLVTGNASVPKECKSPTCTVLRPDPSINGQGGRQGEAAAGEEERPHAALWKNLAYLTAVSHGARFLLDADCSVPLSEAVKTLQSQPRKDYGLMYNETLLFNPYAHFEAWATVPRAFAGGKKAVGHNNSRLYYVRDFDSVLVKHGLSDESQDMVVRSGAPSGTRYGRRFSPSSTSVFLGQKSFSPAVPVCSLYQRDAFWGLLLPCLSHSLRCHVLRQFVLQRLFRELDAFSGFYQLSSLFRNAGHSGHGGGSHSGDAVDVEGLAWSLDSWKCKPGWKFFQCFTLLADYLREKGHLERLESSLMKSWIVALQKSGAVEPAIVSFPWRGVRKTSEVRVTVGSVRTRLESGGAGEERYLREHLVDVVKARCNGTGGGDWFRATQWGKPVIEDVVLIVVFNINRFFWNNLPFLETMHRPFFKHIVYCVANVDELLAGNGSEVLRHVTLVEGLSDQWYLMYECVTTVARMNFQGVRGYLQIGDDTLLNTWMLFNASRDAMWIPQGFTTMRADDSTHSWGWYWWRKFRGRPAVLHALADLERASGMSSQNILRLDPSFNKTKSPKRRTMTFSEIYTQAEAGFPPKTPKLPRSEVWEKPSREDVVKFLTNYYKANRQAGLVKHRAMDLFYIPQVLKEAYIKFSHHFMSHRVLIELAVPVLHSGLAPRSEVKYIKASSLWYGDRNNTFFSYNKSIFFLHPFKMKAHLAKKDSKEFFCHVFLKTLFSHLSTKR